MSDGFGVTHLIGFRESSFLFDSFSECYSVRIRHTVCKDINKTDSETHTYNIFVFVLILFFFIRWDFGNGFLCRIETVLDLLSLCIVIILHKMPPIFMIYT